MFIDESEHGRWSLLRGSRSSGVISNTKAVLARSKRSLERGGRSLGGRSAGGVLYA